ncbi:ATPase family AAA domain-containing protein 5 [Myxocyprinus asiaticus]|uniref:ATPase family AAA domain-containing protein 5 n=1 Tax=Myxocyprinus asiaticus TaxID=70543 RepID=UPI0022233D3D|nr:ATPase family AAA domain-containing protein 5 [Myxocyprinus asiaticus]XP_051572152.1 ATPase family AAA domain-containing protein 5 [Myxocyprinus asiaticus]
MAGAVAMAAVMEDFEGQPCKKLRKDADPPPVRTITNYFMPKQVEKPFSPPRSNNIMDYFKRALPAQEIKSSPVTKENSPQSSEQVRSPEILSKSVRAQGQKRIRKPKENKKYKQEDAQEATDDVVLIESPSESAVKERAISSTSGSDTSDLLTQTSHDVSSDKESGGRKKATEPDPNAMKVKNSVESSAPNDPVEDKSKSKKSAVRRNRKAKGSCEETRWCASDAQKSEQPICETKIESSADKSPTQSSSTIKISFEDFLQNHSQDQDLGNAIPKSDSIVPDTVSEGNTCNDQRDSAIGLVQVSPRTLTIQAEVHPISPDHESVKDSKELKVASIFSRNRKSKIKEDKTLSVPTPEVKPDIFPDHKRKSNVVLLEEDLELDVVESSPMPKSIEAERKQFMNAFKQPSLDGLKSKTNKGQSKQNQVEEQVPEAVDKEDVEQSMENKPEVTSSEQNKEQKSSTGGGEKQVRKPGKKGKAKTAEDALVPTQKPEELPTEMGVDKKSSPADDDDDSKQTVRELRRSTRELSRRQSATVLETDATSQKKGKQENKVKDDVTQNTPSLASTPKVHRPKRGIYRAEMVCPPDTKGSPIRMRITRVLPSSATKAGDFEISSPLATKELNACKKRKQARKLVQKAKALQQSKKDTTKVKETPRRSSRSKESIINYCEDEELVVFLDQSKSTPVTSQESGKKQKRLRSLNEVLGKVTAQNKESKTPAASKLAPLFVEKKAQRPSGVISIFDDSSQEASENSQSDEQFRAKREFLKSGLPETFKKQIAKTAASREAYSQACASFQTVVHIQQRASDCSIWKLQWPLNPFLICVKESYNLPSVPLMILERSLGFTTVPTKRTFSQRVSCCRKEISEPVRQHLLEEIRSSNPSFPHQRFFTLFVKRHEDYILQASASEPEGESKTFCPAGSSESGIGRKRKRVDEGEGTGKVGKKTKSSHIEGEVILIEGSPPSGKSGGLVAQGVTEIKPFGRSRRGRSKRQKQKEEPKPAEVTSPVGNQSDSPITLVSPVPGATGTEDGVKEDVLWSEKYQPQHSDDLIGNLESVRRLHSWLKEWKLRADREEKRKQQEKKQEESNDSWLIGDGGVGLEEMEDLLCNTLLITGPTGVGKTAAVYACAQELGFKVFEVNSSSQRSGRQILSQLKEATQSHQVDIQGVNAHKPSYFSNYSSTNSNTRPGTSPRKVNSPRKPPQSPRSAPSRRGGLAPTSLTSFFKAGGRATVKEASNQEKKAQPACPKKSAKAKETDSKSKECPCETPAGISTEDQGKRTATSLILFEEVDVIFDDDTGFLAAVKTFMTTTKRPVILTTSDPTFIATFDGYFEEIHFKAPSVADVSSYLQLLCLAENMRTDVKDVSSLLEWNRCDIRQSLLHLQFWACSGGGQQVQRPLHSSELKSEVKFVKAEYSLPPCHTACTESLLGILNVQTENIADSLLKHESSVLESMRCWDLLSEVQRRGVDLLYSNMESLLPLPTQLLSLSTLKSQAPPNPPPQPEQVSQAVSLKVLNETSDDGSPLKVSSIMRGKKKLIMANKNVFQSDSESEDEFLSLPKPDNAPVQRTNAELADQPVKESDVSQAAPLKLRCAVLTEADKKKSVPVLQCLSSLAEYMDHISFLDSSMHYQPSQTEGSCRPHDFVWTGAEVKSGMTDELRLQWDSQVNGVSAEEIHSALGHLSFRKCRAAITEAWGKAQELEEDIRRKAEEELTLPVAPHRQGFSLTQAMPCESRVMERRSEVIKSVLSSRLAGTLGNRAAVALDYLPSLRNICRSERLKEQGKIKRRFLHYLDGIHFTLPKSTVEFLASEFP